MRSDTYTVYATSVSSMQNDDGDVVVVGVKVYCLMGGPRPMGGMPSVGVFQKDPSPYLH